MFESSKGFLFFIFACFNQIVFLFLLFEMQ